jgi:hypothetical protein
MEVIFVGAKDNAELNQVAVEQKTAIIGLNITNAGTLTKEGFPQFRFYPSLKVVTFGVQRLHKPEERAALMPISGQAHAFVTQNPGWLPTKLYRPIYDITPDDSLAAALLEEETRPILLAAGTKLSAMIHELSEYSASPFSFVKVARPRLINSFLNEFPYPFRDTQGKSRTESCQYYMYQQEDFWAEKIEQLVPVERVYPQMKSEIIFRNEFSALILIESEKYGTDQLVAQQYFQMNPKTVRLVLMRKVFNSQKHYVSIVNSNLYDNDLSAYPYPNVKELNALERKVAGDPSWKNLKFMTIGPKKGTALLFDAIWEHVKLGA